MHDMERVCEMEFQRWCAEELTDPRLRAIHEEAFIAGFQIGLEIEKELEHERLSAQPPPDAPSPGEHAGDPGARAGDADDRRRHRVSRRPVDHIPALAEVEGEAHAT